MDSDLKKTYDERIKNQAKELTRLNRVILKLNQKITRLKKSIPKRDEGNIIIRSAFPDHVDIEIRTANTRNGILFDHDKAREISNDILKAVYASSTIKPEPEPEPEEIEEDLTQ